MLPRVEPAKLIQLAEPFDHEDWIQEIKLDGFRGLAYVERGRCDLVSRNHHTFRTFPGLCQSLVACLPDREAILDGEIVVLDRAGRPQFNPLLYRRAEPHFAAFDLLWLDGQDLRQLPLLERKRRLCQLVPAQPCRMLYVQHLDARGVDLFRAVCAQDLEGIVAKLAAAPYDPGRPSWVKIKNRVYSQAVGRRERFEAFQR